MLDFSYVINLDLARQYEIRGYFGISRTTLWRLEKKGLPSIRVQGSNPWYEPKVVLQWIKSQPTLRQLNEQINLNE